MLGNHNINPKQIYIRAYSTLSELERALQSIKEKNVTNLHISILGKAAHFYLDKKISNDIHRINTHWKALFSNTINFGSFCNPESGTLFIVGSLVSTFLYKINDKNLGVLSDGLLGVMRGIGLNEIQTTKYLKLLREDNYLLIIRGFEDELQSLDYLI